MDFDIAIKELLDAWAPRIGRPTCAPGCARCCDRTSVTISSAEALQLLDSLEAKPAARVWRAAWSGRVRAVEAKLREGASPSEALNALLDEGSCVFLENSRCGVYGVRPDACRVCFVWHDASFCAREDYDMCTPAELNELRVMRIHDRMIAEAFRGRRPYFGQLAPAVWAMDRHRAAYLRGKDLSGLLDPAWVEADLLEFPPGATLEDVRRGLEQERLRLAKLFQEEEHPMGFPRGADARDRAFLDAFPLD